VILNQDGSKSDASSLRRNIDLSDPDFFLSSSVLKANSGIVF
jgi:hypothetical protein